MSKGSKNLGDLEWLGLREVTQYAAVSERTLRAWIRSPTTPLPAVKVGTKILIRRSEFDAWLERHRVKHVDLGGMLDEIVEAVTNGR